ncbi:hypothetical protein pb186bvf_003709 [Paramecium bursaria]
MPVQNLNNKLKIYLKKTKLLKRKNFKICDCLNQYKTILFHYFYLEQDLKLGSFNQHKEKQSFNYIILYNYI